ncbi:MAG: hypothetical protein K0S91_1731 [Nitrososphaeraceae archaeon]|nr:hypothetical protein [Nitrososphaeraceae archaeon]
MICTYASKANEKANKKDNKKGTSHCRYPFSCFALVHQSIMFRRHSNIPLYNELII